MNNRDRDRPASSPTDSAADDQDVLQDMPRWAADDSMEPDALAEAFTALSVALPAPPAGPELRARLLARATDPEHRFAPFVARLARLIDVAQTRARALLAGLARPEIWQAFLPGVELVHLEAGPACVGADVGFVRVKAGATFPVHHHRGDERVLVLQGGYTDSAGAVGRAGDLVELPAGSSHSLTALPDGPDLIYAVVVFGVDIPGAPPLHSD
jgi:quercetin dioxygenase-like cupin family protein